MAKTPPAKQYPAQTPASRQNASAKVAGRPAGLFTWIAVGLVLVVVAALVIIKVTSGSPSASARSFQPTDSATLAQVTGVPDAVFNTVGVKSTVAPVSPPIPLAGQPALLGSSSTGASVPEVFYLGAEYCPFCAAERWSTIVALSRFGKFSNLGNTSSSTLSGEVYPDTQSFTFLKATYASKYLAFKGVEQFTNVPDPATNFYYPLENPTAQESRLFKKYDTSKYIPGITAQQDGSIPFISIGNKFLVSGASYTPATLAGLSRSQIAAGLSDPTSPVTDAIIATANYQSATFCVLTKNRPGSVCASPGVVAAKKAMGLK